MVISRQKFGEKRLIFSVSHDYSIIPGSVYDLARRIDIVNGTEVVDLKAGIIKI